VPILREGELDIISYNAEQTQRLGTRLGTLLKPGDIICLSGDMGAGKTVFSAGIGKGWGALSPLTSPTFNIVHQHRRNQDKQTLYHMDCYRLQSAEDAEGVGLEEILDGHGPVIVEWPEKIEAVLPRQRLWLELRILEPTRRNLVFEATGERYEQLVKEFSGISFGV
jgi:tRNA threonylcarbamoyladenosine biosynthesis protein TsaE